MVPHNDHTEIRHLITFRRKLFMSAAIGPAKPIAIPTWLVATHISHPIPEPAHALKIAAIASVRNDNFSLDLGSIGRVPFVEHFIKQRWFNRSTDGRNSCQTDKSSHRNDEKKRNEAPISCFHSSSSLASQATPSRSWS